MFLNRAPPVPHQLLRSSPTAVRAPTSRTWVVKKLFGLSATHGSVSSAPRDPQGTSSHLRAFYSLPSTRSLKRTRTSRGLMQFVTAALPKAPICARKLVDRTSLTSVPGVSLARHRRTRSVRAAEPPECRGGASEPGFLVTEKDLYTRDKDPGLMQFVTEALPKAPTCARKLVDRTSLTSVTGASLARHRRARSVRSAAPPEGRGGGLSHGVLFSPLNPM